MAAQAKCLQKKVMGFDQPMLVLTHFTANSVHYATDFVLSAGCLL